MKPVYISDETHKQLKRHALNTDKKLKEIVAEALILYLSATSKKAKS